MTHVTLYTRRNCHLCDAAKDAIRKSGAGVDVTEVDVDTDPELVRRYGEHVPVVVIGGVEAFRHRVDPAAFAAYLRGELGDGWTVVNNHHLEREFKFPDFAKALAFTNAVGAIAEEQQHHPDIYLSWGKVRITTWTHDTGGLTSKDYALVGKIDGLTTGSAR